eukprot:CAMPEP_0185904194 /NCGR_PEP_ID=MMETSP0196C-20130402/3520_1 /TAXON_ID=2932 /ORGANISM="Alexandrium fundyense, Strain CCMP1719" /LENGTH=57 /DNA_ID=CAMNT_0028623457 /DNA_START=78 /DNA_END=248 /DNA_ORIENTATION=+
MAEDEAAKDTEVDEAEEANKALAALQASLQADEEQLVQEPAAEEGEAAEEPAAAELD